MIHLRVVVPPELAEKATAELAAQPSVVNVIRIPGAAKKPPGDLILCDVAREEASLVLEDLRALGVETFGSVVVEEGATELSPVGKAAEHAASGSASDAIVWEEVEARTSESSELSFSFLGFMTIATLIAAVGILTDSQILIIGAMVVGPEFGPVAGICVAAVERRAALAVRSAAALAVGFPLAIVGSLALTAILRGVNRAPDALTPSSHPATLFISNPNVYSVIVAILAGVAGVTALTSAKSGALMGVLISVATIPAAANVGVAAAYGDWSELGGALAQLGINLVCLIAAGIATLAVQRALYARRRRGHVLRRVELP